MKKYGIVIFLTLLGLFPSSVLAAAPPSLAGPPGLSLVEVKITGNEFVMLINNTGSAIPDLSKYWLYNFNNTNPLSGGVSSSTQQLPVATLANGQTVLLNSNGGSTCGAAVTAKLSLSLTDAGGFLEIVQTSVNSSGVLVQTAGDALSWSSGANSAPGMIANVPSSTAAPNGAYYRYQNGSPGAAAYLWQSANQDTGNACQLNVTVAGVTTVGPTNPGISLSPGAPPSAIFVSDDSASPSAVTSIPASDIGLSSPVITELLPNPADPKTDSEDEFIELYNSNSQAFDLSGFKLQTGTTTLHNYTFPAGTMIASSSFAAYYSIDTNLSLSNSGGQVRLLDPGGNIISQSDTYSKADDGLSWSLADGKWYWTTQQTAGATNVIHQVLAQPYTLPTTAAKQVAPKSSKSTATPKSTTAKAVTAKPLAPKPASKPPGLHPLVLAAVGALALGYAAYEYRHDWQTESTSSADTERLGELIGSRIQPPMSLELLGDLGAGKTSLVRGLARGCGSKSLVTSPSFSLSQIYDCGDGKKLYHFDLYRLGDEPGLLEDELAEALTQPKAIVVVEWSQSVKKLLPKNTISLLLLADPDDGDIRRIKLKYPPEYREIITEVESQWVESRP